MAVWAKRKPTAEARRTGSLCTVQAGNAGLKACLQCPDFGAPAADKGQGRTTPESRRFCEVCDIQIQTLRQLRTRSRQCIAGRSERERFVRIQCDVTADRSADTRRCRGCSQRDGGGAVVPSASTGDCYGLGVATPGAVPTATSEPEALVKIMALPVEGLF